MTEILILFLTIRYTQEKDKIVVYSKEVDVLRKVSLSLLFLSLLFNFVSLFCDFFLFHKLVLLHLMFLK